MIYKENEIDISTTNYSDGVAIIPLTDGSIICIPEDGATAEELEIIARIKADVEARAISTIDEAQLLENAKSNKIQELQTACNTDIMSGFICSVKDEDRVFGSNMDDQINMISQLTLFNSNSLLETVIWKCKGSEGIIDSYTKDEFMQICLAFETAKRDKIGKFWTLKQDVIISTVVEDVNLIEWEEELCYK